MATQQYNWRVTYVENYADGTYKRRQSVIHFMPSIYEAYCEFTRQNCARFTNLRNMGGNVRVLKIAIVSERQKVIRISKALHIG